MTPDVYIHYIRNIDRSRSVLGEAALKPNILSRFPLQVVTNAYFTLKDFPSNFILTNSSPPNTPN